MEAKELFLYKVYPKGQTPVYVAANSQHAAVAKASDQFVGEDQLRFSVEFVSIVYI